MQLASSQLFLNTSVWEKSIFIFQIQKEFIFIHAPELFESNPNSASWFGRIREQSLPKPDSFATENFTFHKVREFSKKTNQLLGKKWDHKLSSHTKLRKKGSTKWPLCVVTEKAGSFAVAL